MMPQRRLANPVQSFGKPLLMVEPLPARWWTAAALGWNGIACRLSWKRHHVLVEHLPASGDDDE